MAADPITAVGNALSGLFSILKPSIDEHFAQKYNDSFKSRVDAFQGILAQPDPAHRATQLGEFVQQLCNDAGTPIGVVSGQSIEVPVEYFTALVTATAEYIRDRDKLAKLSFTTGQS